jgi:hypothetical protein
MLRRRGRRASVSVVVVVVVVAGRELTRQQRHEIPAWARVPPGLWLVASQMIVILGVLSSDAAWQQLRHNSTRLAIAETWPLLHSWPPPVVASSWPPPAATQVLARQRPPSSSAMECRRAVPYLHLGLPFQMSYRQPHEPCARAVAGFLAARPLSLQADPQDALPFPSHAGPPIAEVHERNP